RDGKLWFSTVKGLVQVDPQNLPMNDQPPPVVLEELIVDGTVIARDPDFPSQVEIGAGALRIEFLFTALSLLAPERNRFKYRLDGLDNGWVEAGSARSA